MTVLEIVLCTFLMVFLYLAIEHILSKVIFDNFQKPTLLYYLIWPVIFVFYLFGAIGALFCRVFLFMMYIISRPFESMITKTWTSKDTDFEEMSEQ